MGERFERTPGLLARVAWSRLAEPGDVPAGALLRAVGPQVALDWLRSGTDQPPGVSPHPGWRAAGGRWRPRLRGLDPSRELDVISRRGGTVLVPGEARWPTALDDLGDAAPLCLWVLGGRRRTVVDLLGCAAAVVGARACTHYGESVTREICEGLGARGVTVVSGGAYGIDAAAHRSCLAAGRPTVSVMAGGLDRWYPVGHSDLLHEICEGGAVVSEAPPGTAPMRQRFLSRNRLIAALGRGTVVVEAAWRSGALNTARHAAELLRPVAAVPGPVTSAASAGCHRLLREGVAVCVTEAAEVLELIGAAGELPPEPEGAPSLLDGLGPDQARVLDALPARAAAQTDSVIRAAGLSATQTLAALGHLELAGAVERHGTGWRRARG